MCRSPCRGAPALVFPVLVHQLGIGLQVPGQQQVAAAVAQFLGQVEVVEHLRVAGLRALVLIAQHRRGAARLPRVEEQQVVAQLAQRCVVQLERLDVNAPVAVERVRADAAMGSDVLVLLADRLLQHVDLDLAGGLGEAPWGDRGAARVRQALQQADRESAEEPMPVPAGTSATEAISSGLPRQ